MKGSDIATGAGFAGATAVPIVHQIPSVPANPFYSEVWAFGLTGSEWSFALLFTAGIVGLIVKVIEWKNAVAQSEINRITLKELES